MLLTVITPTTGKESLGKLIETIEKQSINKDVYHVLLWDDYRSHMSILPTKYNSKNRISLVLPNGFGRRGAAPGSALRSVGLMVAETPWVTFADDDVWWENDHLTLMLDLLNQENKKWGYCHRKIWTSSGKYLGIDRFESVGNLPSRKVSYEMCDNNCMMFKRHLGVEAAQFYRETTEYNDDRLMYSFLKKNGGIPITSYTPSVNHICPDRLIEFFTTNCVMI